MTNSTKAIYLTYQQQEEKGYQSLVEGNINEAKEHFDNALNHLKTFINAIDEYYQATYLPRVNSLNKMIDRINKELDKEKSLKEHADKEDDSSVEFLPVTTSVHLEDVKGLIDVKTAVNNMVINPLKYREIYQAFSRNAGGAILMYGVPGTGKTMIAQAIANAIDAKFFSVSCSDIVSKWHGESEGNIKKLFEAADKFDKSIIFFDEFETLGAARSDDRCGASNNVVSELLVQLQGFKEKDPNKIRLIIAATNRPWEIDSALTRPGRLNTLICVGLPDYESRLAIVESHLGKCPIEDGLSFEEVAKMSEGYSGADVVDFCNKIKDIAIARSIKIGKLSPITNNDVKEAKKKSYSSVSPIDLQRIKEYQIQ